MNILYVDNSGVSIAASIFVMVLMAIGVWLITSVLWLCDFEKEGILVGIIFASIVIVVFATIGIVRYPEANKPKIYVTIDDDQTFKDIYSKYKIKEQKGDLYILAERDDTDAGADSDNSN